MVAKNLMKKIYIVIVLFYGLTIFFLQNSVKIKKIRQTKIKIPSILTTAKRKSIFCLIIASPNDIETRAKAIHSTWAQKCDNAKFITEIEQVLKIDKSKNNFTHLNEITYKNISILEPYGMNDDKYSKLTDKLYLAFRHLHDNYNDYDWYLKADVDTFIFVDNLREFLSDKNKSSPVTFGCDFAPWLVDYGYHSGGAGYLLSNEALKRLGSKLKENYTFCPNTGKKGGLHFTSIAKIYLF